MLRALLNRQLGIFNPQDQRDLAKFLLNRFDDLLNDLDSPQSDRDCQHLFAMCENILHTLSLQKIDLMLESILLSTRYDQCSAQIPDFQAKKMLLQFRYQGAAEKPNLAMILLKQQEDLNTAVFTEDQMMQLIHCIRYKQRSYRYYSIAVSRLANYYFRLSVNHPTHLIHYALYLTEEALTGNTDIAIGLNALLMRRLDIQELRILFGQWQMTADAENNTIIATHGPVQLSLTHFIETISGHAVSFAAIAYQKAYADSEQRRQSTFNLFRGRESATLRTLRSHLINCMQKLPTQGHLLTSGIHTLLSDLANHKSKTVSECANHILKACKTQSSIERRPSSTCSAHSSTTS